MDVYLTCDTEVWCPSWAAIDDTFPEAYRRYVHGVSGSGDGGALHYLARTLRAHDLQGVFFVEPLFSLRFGHRWLREIVDLVRSEGQQVQLHLHTEWQDEGRPPPLPHITEKRQHLRMFSLDDQQALIAAGASLLVDAAAPRPTAFRAGSYALNRDTLQALVRCGIRQDSSYNAAVMGGSSGLETGEPLFDRVELDGVTEYPVSVFRDGLGRLRPAQVGACSWAEMRQALDAAHAGGWHSFVIVFHNFEALSPDKLRQDHVVRRRFEHLCRYLAVHRDRFTTRVFGDDAGAGHGRPSPDRIHTNRRATAWRVAEQAFRHLEHRWARTVRFSTPKA